MAKQPILLVEDNQDDEELILLSLREQNIANEIIVARDGVEALDFIFATGVYKDRPPSQNPALVLLDLKLPKLGGFDVLKRLRSDGRTTLLPVVILTSSNEERDIIKSYELGVNSFVRKPIDFVEFQQVVRQLGIYWMLVNESPRLPA
jgi:CheY-like chemotaxis protein